MNVMASRRRPFCAAPLSLVPITALALLSVVLHAVDAQRQPQYEQQMAPGWSRRESPLAGNLAP